MTRKRSKFKGEIPKNDVKCDDFDEVLRGTGEEPGGEVSCRVDCVSTVESEANPDCEHCQTHKEGHQLSANLLFMIKPLLSSFVPLGMIMM